MSLHDPSPSEMIQFYYYTASACRSSLAEIARVNPSLLEQVIDLAIMIGINAAHERIERDKKMELIAKWPSEPMFGVDWGKT